MMGACSPGYKTLRITSTSMNDLDSTSVVVSAVACWSVGVGGGGGDAELVLT